MSGMGFENATNKEKNERLLRIVCPSRLHDKSHDTGTA
jgi:hypothetical protein